MSSGFKMKGYTYPGTSPVKGRRKEARAAAAGKADDAMSTMEEQLGKEYKSSSILSPTKLKIDWGEVRRLLYQPVFLRALKVLQKERRKIQKITLQRLVWVVLSSVVVQK